MNTIDLERWRGARDAEALDPAAIEFAARPKRGQSCAGCLFERQWAKVCDLATAEAIKRGLPSCDDSSVVYRLVERDPRQLAIECD